MKIKGIKTDLGNQIMEDLLKDGWQKVKEYNRLAFDKGIDFDSYTLQKGTMKLEFEWTNWFEWEIKGPESIIKTLEAQYVG